MIVNTRYEARSGIVNGLGESLLGFATNTLREATFFRGEVRDPLALREGLAALYTVVVSDFKYRPKDRLEYRAWLEEQDQKFLRGLGADNPQTRARLEEIETRLAELDAEQRERRADFYKARRAYFDWAYTQLWELELLLDPVITVHPDELFFEAFSKDESSYARLGVPLDRFKDVGELQCGTTNIDFGAGLHRELERMRSYRGTRLGVDPSGFEVASQGREAHREKKIDLPDSWVRGFHQVHSVMALGLTRIELAPIDLYNLCRALRRRKARTSPRALRWELVPGQRPRAVLEPWEQVIEMDSGSRFDGPKPMTVRTWGRDRLRILERLVPTARGVELYLAGLGLPSIYVVDLGGPRFTLALSGWTDNDWTGGQASFESLARPAGLSAAELFKAHDALRDVRRSSEAELALTTGLGMEKTRSAMGVLCRVGRAMYDLSSKAFRHRELFATPWTLARAEAALKAASGGGSPQEKTAEQIIAAGNLRVTSRRPAPTGYKLTGSAKGPDGKRCRPLLSIDKENRIIEAKCSCAYYKQHRMTKGPCEHVLALRLEHMARLDAEGA